MPPVFPREAEPPIIVALDIGTSSVRALCFDRRGCPLAGLEGRAAYAMEVTPDGGVQTDADAMVARAVNCLDALLAALGAHPLSIAAVAISAFWHSLVGVDASGHAVTPLYGWGDTRSQAEAAALRQRLDEGAGVMRCRRCRGTFAIGWSDAMWRPFEVRAGSPAERALAKARAAALEALTSALRLPKE